MRAEFGLSRKPAKAERPSCFVGYPPTLMLAECPVLLMLSLLLVVRRRSLWAQSKMRNDPSAPLAVIPPDN